jgi:tetratricopeptide (TPR) repeat protein
VLTTIEEPARGPAADEGVRPTIDADGRNWENYVALVYPAFPLVCRMKGVALFELDDPESALAAFDHAIALDPTYHRARAGKRAALARLAQLSSRFSPPPTSPDKPSPSDR